MLQLPVPEENVKHKHGININRIYDCGIQKPYNIHEKM